MNQKQITAKSAKQSSVSQPFPENINAKDAKDMFALLAGIKSIRYTFNLLMFIMLLYRQLDTQLNLIKNTEHAIYAIKISNSNSNSSNNTKSNETQTAYLPRNESNTAN